MTGTHQGYKFLSRSARTNLPWEGPTRVRVERTYINVYKDVNFGPTSVQFKRVIARPFGCKRHQMQHLFDFYCLLNSRMLYRLATGEPRNAFIFILIQPWKSCHL